MSNLALIDSLKNDSEFTDLLFLVNCCPLVIKNKHDLKRSIELFQELTEKVYETLESDAAIKKAEEYIEILSTNIDRFEQNIFEFEQYTPIEIIEFLIEQNGLKKKDLSLEFGSAPMVSEVLHGKRDISAKIARALGNRFKVSPGLFL